MKEESESESEYEDDEAGSAFSGTHEQTSELVGDTDDMSYAVNKESGKMLGSNGSKANSKSVQNFNIKKNKKKKKSVVVSKPDKDHKDHKNCELWGCTCKNKVKA